MNFRTAVFMTLALTLALAASASAEGLLTPHPGRGAQTISRHFISGGGRVFVVMPPVLISGPEIVDAKWSPDGKWVAFRRYSEKISPQVLEPLMKSPTDPAAIERLKQSDVGDVEMILYSRGKTYVVWKGQLGKTDVSEYQWVTNDVLVSTTQTQESPEAYTTLVTRIAKSQLTTTTLPAAKDSAEVGTSPDFANALVISDDVLYLFRGNGQDSQVKLREGEGIQWAANGDECYVSGAGPDNGKWYAVGQRELVPLSQKPELLDPKKKTDRPEAPAGPLKVALRDTSMASSTGQTIDGKSLWLEVRGGGDKQLPGLISGDVSKAWLSPQGNAVLYVTMDGAAFIRNVSQMNVSEQEMDKQRAAAQRTVLVANCRQIGLALMMYSADNNDQLPDPGRFAESLKAYMKNGVDQSFQYTFSGANLTDIAEPSNTVMGYIAGEGGFAVVYADGHVVWREQLP